MTKKAVEEQQTLKRERYESRCAVKKRRYLWCNNATLPAQGGHGWCKNATLPVRGLSNRVDVCPSVDKNIENTNNQLKYAVIRPEKQRLSYSWKIIVLIAISCICKSSHYLFQIVGRLLRPFSIRIKGTKLL